MSLVLGKADDRAIRLHGEETYPTECCGFLLGTGSGDHKEVIQLRRARNEAVDRLRTRYLISPEEYLRAQQQAGKTGLDIVGFYHSHPDSDPRPSAFDRRHALPWCSYVIVSVKDGRSRELNSWVLSADGLRFHPEIVSARPLGKSLV